MSKRYRTLIPAPILGESQPPPEPERPPEKRQKSHLACGHCRLKKNKCDGKRPTCDRCIKRKVVCVYAEEDKASTIAGLQIQVQKLRQELHEHTNFIAYLQSVPAPEANNVLKVTSVESSSSWEGQNALSSPWQGILSTTISSVSGPSETPKYCDERLKHLNIGYWTRVPLDNVFAASAISLYLESEHPFFAAFDADLVIDSLVYQRVDFCSPFLAVSLFPLTVSHYLIQQSFTTVDIKSSSLVPALFHEAHKLYRAEGLDNKPMTIAATMLFGFGCAMAGREALGLELFTTVRRKAVETSLFGVRHADSVDDQWEAWRQLSPDQLRERAHVAWGSFNWLTESGSQHTYTIATILAATLFARIYGTHHQCPEQALHHNPGATCSLQLCGGRDSNGPQPSLAFAETKFQDLLSWADGLPDELACGNNSPAHTYLLLSVWSWGRRKIAALTDNAVLSSLYHGTVLYILRPFLGTAPAVRLRSFAAKDSTLDRIFNASMKQLKRLLYIYVSQLQSNLYSPILSCGILHLTTALMKESASPKDKDRDEWHFYFRLSLNYLAELYKRYPMWIDIIKANLAMAVDSGNLAGAEAFAIMADITRKGQHHGILEHVFTSCIVDFDLALTDPDRARVHELALKFDQLALFDEFTTVADVSEVDADGDADPEV
ncbi:hypothetical protein PG987_016487 [Apiospora arundinis]